MAQLSAMGTKAVSPVKPGVPKPTYFKLSPATPRYYRLKKISEQEQIPLEEVVRNALDFYLSFQEKRIIVVAPR